MFFLQLADSDLTPIDSTFTLEAATITPAIITPTLFPNHVVIAFDQATPSEMKFFQAVHLGQVMLNIEPTDTALPPVRVQLEVTEPASLGGAPNQFDALFIDLGHLRGIPPQLLKGQVRQESNFNPQAYRYEPLSVDLAYLSTCFSPFIPGQCNFRQQPPYALYRLATADGLPQGAEIREADITPRSLYCLLAPDGTRRRITDADRFVSVAAIFAANDAVSPGDLSGCVSQNWRQFVDRGTLDAIRRNPTLLNFTAQTPLAASYGLLQILYPTAIAPMGWQGVNGARNPNLLFDTSVNLDAGGGSLVLGSGYLRRSFLKANPTVSVDDPDFAHQGTLEGTFRRAFNYYNGQRQGTLDTAMYGPAVLNFARTFLPTSAGPIFP